MAAVDPAATAAHGPAVWKPRSRDGRSSDSRAYLELVRLLREATEIEHALMLQHLYAAFPSSRTTRTLPAMARRQH
jgi:hypothetical protein